MRRLLRESFRHAKHDLPRGLQLVLIAAAGDLCNLFDLCDELSELRRRIRSPHPA